jgi:hypothetical protein
MAVEEHQPASRLEDPTHLGDGPLLMRIVMHLETWAHPLELGRALPTLPLWLAGNLAVPLELDASYEETCRVLRIP